MPPLKRIIQIDTKRQSALVEPRVTMYELAHVAYKHNLFVPVVPEFKEITVGGAIMGAAGESSSRAYGIFSDTLLRCEVLLGNGSCVKASAQEESELFFALPGSYGSLGTLLLAEIQLIPAPSLIQLTHRFFADAFATLQALRELCGQTHPPMYIEALLFSPSAGVLLTAQPLFNDTSAPKTRLTRPWSPWFYQHVQAKAHSQDYIENILPLEYLFRYDRGAFWMGSYLLRPRILFDFLWEGWGRKEDTFSPYGPEVVDPIRPKTAPQLLTRLLTSGLMSSQQLYSLLHRGEAWVRDKFIIQDVCIPEHNAPQFLQTLLQEVAIFPLWLCPIRTTNTPQLFAPHLQSKNQEDFVINFGIYGLPQKCTPIAALTRQLEREAAHLQGRKVLYSHSYYTKEEFWQIYSQPDYQALRKKYYAEKVWHDLLEKIL
jgi:delta24-sterol reductase